MVNCNLTSEIHIEYITSQCSKINVGFRILKKFFNKDELLKLATSMFYAKLYYAAAVWFLPNISNRQLQKLMTSSSSILKTITGHKCNQDDQMSYQELHKICNRATPVMFREYITITTLHRILVDNTPEDIWLDLLNGHQHSGRHYKPRFVRSNTHRVGSNCLVNRVQNCTNRFEYDMTTLNKDQLKAKAKRQFLSFN